VIADQQDNRGGDHPDALRRAAFGGFRHDDHDAADTPRRVAARASFISVE
jgi:hypothetical protein